MSIARTIHKFAVERAERQVINVVGYIDKLDLQLQEGRLVMWCTVLSPATEVREIEIRIVGTGAPIPEDLSLRTYWRTVADGRYIWHIFVNEGYRA